MTKATKQLANQNDGFMRQDELSMKIVLLKDLLCVEVKETGGE